jgi:hypothetical protein
MPSSAPTGSISPLKAAIPTARCGLRAGGLECHRDREPFGNVLDGDRGGQRKADGKVALRKRHADRHAFRQVVQRDREHEQPHPADPVATCTVVPEVFVRVRRELVEAEHQQYAKSETGDDGQRAERGAAGQRFAGRQTRQDQRERARCQHHACRQAEHGVLGAAGQIAQEQRRQRTERSGGKTGHAAQQAQPQRRIGFALAHPPHARQQQPGNDRDRQHQPGTGPGVGVRLRQPGGAPAERRFVVCEFHACAPPFLF